MKSKPLRTLKLSLRLLSLLTSLLLLILASLALITLSQHHLPSPIPVRAVAGISGAALLYSTLCVLALRFARPETTTSPPVSLLSMVLDTAFAAAMIYVASANSVGGGGCGVGREVETWFGGGMIGGGEGVGVGVDGGCRVAVGGLVAGVVGIFLFIFSILTELGLIRQRRRESRFAPGPISGTTTTMPGAWGGEDEKKEGGGGRGGGFWGWLTGKRKGGEAVVPLAPNPDALPGHALPEDVRRSQAAEEDRLEMGEAWGEMRRGDGDGYRREDRAGYGRGEGVQYEVVGNVDGYGNGYGHGRQAYVGGGDLGYGGDRMEEVVPLARFPPANYRYGDGVYDRV